MKKLACLVFLVLVLSTGLSLTLLVQGADPPKKGPLPPAEAFKKLQTLDDLALDQVLTEPVVRQPVFLNFDERGRMWVVQYLQYPSPAGLKMVSRDKFWRAVWDKVPPPPPNHFKGKDKITIHEDTRGDGSFGQARTFVDGLNIATAVARGRGGVWVLNPPYLLFYPDRDNDDVPDGPPEVHLEGFGLEDTHSVVNSLCWGPDGWLYAAQGSTVTGAVRRPGDKNVVHSLGQNIWRYHPETRRYEIFAEGGGNAFGVEIDSKGRVYSGYNGGDTRGFHYVQGGYYRKGFEKHGALSNPYAFGYFPPMKHPKVQRFTHNFLIYEGGSLPKHYTGNLFGVDPLQNNVVVADVQRDGSTFQTRDIGHAIKTTDPCFRPVDVKLGPDGAVYVCDWYDDQVKHFVSADGKFDDSNGRIYRIRPASPHRQVGEARPIDLSKLSGEQLVSKLVESPNRWVRQTTLRLLGDRKDRTLVPLLRKLLKEQTGQAALECLWALNLVGGLDEPAALAMLEHADPYVRLWTIRLLGDQNQFPASIAARLIKLARTEPDVEVRVQVACSIRRLPVSDLLPIWRQLVTRDEDVNDPHVPLSLWWALEAKAESSRDAVLALFEDSGLWRLPLVEKVILERVMRRYAQAGTQKDLLTCARLLRLAPTAEGAKRLLTGFEQAYTGRPLVNLPQELIEAMAARGGGSLALRVRQGNPEAVAEALKLAANPKADRAQRLQLLPILSEIREKRAVPVLLGVLDQPGDELRQTALTALQAFNDATIGASVVQHYNGFSPDVRSVAETLLASRGPWALQLLEAIDAGQIKPDSVPEAVVRRILLHRNDRLAALAKKHFGEVKGATTAEMRQEIDRLAKVIRGGQGSPYPGKKLFLENCGKCHQLFGKGGSIGPDLTSYKRDDLDNMLLHVVNPSAEVREGFENYLVVTEDGRALNGFLAEKDDKIVVLRGVDGQSIVVPRDKIEEMRVIAQSLMPEGILKPMSEQQVRDLFAYLRSTQPLAD
jgi:putative heme-binding domain-containing protein